MLDLTFGDEEFDVCIDKGSLDALIRIQHLKKQKNQKLLYVLIFFYSSKSRQLSSTTRHKNGHGPSPPRNKVFSSSKKSFLSCFFGARAYRLVVALQKCVLTCYMCSTQCILCVGASKKLIACLGFFCSLSNLFENQALQEALKQKPLAQVIEY
jgi:hypothetical protein